MQVEFTRKFQKQVENCTEKRVKLKVAEIIHDVIRTDSMVDFNNLKKLTGFKNSYRIRVGSYRIGITIEKEKVIFAAFDHRSAIYKYFP